jgi:hypothetical protein
MSKQLKTIDDVISTLEEIIAESEQNNDPLGYFAALYQGVTIVVKEGIEKKHFADGPRMEKLDILFAQRYIDAWRARQNNEPVTQSWGKAFAIAKKKRYLVLQHLLMGMKAHINLDLGIAAAEISDDETITGLQSDFNKINEILSALVNEVQNNLSSIWPLLKRILARTGKLDNFLMDFSMKKARNGAWKSATEMAKLPRTEMGTYIHFRDMKVAFKSRIITNPGFLIIALFWLIRLGERGTVAEKIGKLRYKFINEIISV